MIRWIRVIVCGLLSIAAFGMTAGWLTPMSDSQVNHELVLADEGHRYNIYAVWNHKYYHLLAYPEGVSVVPHRFVMYLVMILRNDGVDLLSIQYRHLTTTAVTPRHIQLLPAVYIQRFVIPADAQGPGQDGWHLTIPLWAAVVLLWAYPAIALIRGPVRRWRRRRRGLCETCRYDLSGLTERRCPECGTAF